MDSTARNILIFGALGVGAYALWMRSRSSSPEYGTPLTQAPARGGKPKSAPASAAPVVVTGPQMTPEDAEAAANAAAAEAAAKGGFGG